MNRNCQQADGILSQDNIGNVTFFDYYINILS